MERPSHILFDNHHAFSRRAPLFGLALCLQLAGLWLFTHGLASGIVTIIPPLYFVPTPQQQVPKTTPPPEPTLLGPKVPTAPLPDIQIDSGPRETLFFKTGPDAGIEPSGQNKTPPAVTHPPAAIPATHTAPPYPPIARRLGVEGKVTLRLTVSAEGRVSAADIATSSGRDDLDQAAQAWILAHWTYKPALQDGAPVASQVLAMVTFNLTNP